MRADEKFQQPLPATYINAAIDLINRNLAAEVDEVNKKLAAKLKMHAALGIAGVVQECARQLGLVEKDSVPEQLVIDHLDMVYQQIRRVHVSPDFNDLDTFEQQQEVVDSLQSIGMSAKQVLVGYMAQKKEAQLRQEFINSLYRLGEAIHELAQRPTVVNNTYVSQYNLVHFGSGNMNVNFDQRTQR